MSPKPEPGSDLRHPQTLDRDDLDLSELRAHCRVMHQPGRIRGGRLGLGPMPRSIRDLTSWHWAQHWRLHLGHIHRGAWTVIRRARGGTTGLTPRPLGWFTGQEAVTREELRS